jgi:hypothetical protein
MKSGLFLKTLATTTVAGLVSAGGAGAQMPSATASANERAITDRYLTTVQTELTTKVDTRNAKIGQLVTARVRDDAQLADGTKLPKGTMLVGHVVQVQAQRDDGPGAVLVLAFDRAEVKSAQPVNLRTVMEMVAPPGNISAGMNGDPRATIPMGPMSTGADVGMNTSDRAGMGGSGGVLGGVARGVGSAGRGTVGAGGIPMGTDGGMDPTGRQTNGTIGTTGGQIGGIDPTGGQVGTAGPLGGDPLGRDPLNREPLNTAGSMGSGAAAASGVRPVVSAGESVSGAPRPTKLPGVMLSRTSAPEVSGMLTAMGRNITLESGTRITMGVITH